MKFLTLEQFKEMWKLQDELNAATSGADWAYKEQDWNLAIKDEVMEFFDYVGWKWWKEPDKTKSPTDLQARLELVDIWHFLLSSIIETEVRVWGKKITSDHVHEAITAMDGQTVFRPAYKSDLSYLKDIDSVFMSNISKVGVLARIIDTCEWSWDELYKAYIGKVALNNFRQANGYKTGSYVKIWETIHFPGPCGDVYEYLEDNYFLEQIMNLLSAKGELTYQNVYEKLQSHYENVLPKL